MAGGQATGGLRDQLWWAAVIAGTSFMVAVVAGWTGPAIIAWKGSGVALLALWAAINARSFDGWLIAAVLACGALGDVLLDAMGMETGAIAFVAGHIIAIWLYARNRRAQPSGSQMALALCVAPAAVVIVWAMLHGNAGWWHAAIYTGFVAVMAAMAWISRFPRYRTGIGAMLFLISDLVIFARVGEVLPPGFSRWLIWPLYFAGQALIARGVVTTLRT